MRKFELSNTSIHKEINSEVRLRKHKPEAIAVLKPDRAVDLAFSKDELTEKIRTLFHLTECNSHFLNNINLNDDGVFTQDTLDKLLGFKTVKAFRDAIYLFISRGFKLNDFEVSYKNKSLMTGFYTCRLQGEISRGKLQSLRVSQISSEKIRQTEDPLLAAKVQYGSVVLSTEIFYFTELMHSLVHSFKPEISRKKIRLKLAVQERFDEFKIQTDREKLSEILNTTIKHAIRYSSGGAINIRCFYKYNLIKVVITADRQNGESGVLTDSSASDCNSGLRLKSDNSSMPLKKIKKHIELLGGELEINSAAGEVNSMVFTIEPVCIVYTK
ncbi:MAG: hypothetical protein U9N85_03515 [Bacteroidota bacterium]|nr:hypothetical protein [Bacteroidota bacterium]